MTPFDCYLAALQSSLHFTRKDCLRLALCARVELIRMEEAEPLIERVLARLELEQIILSLAAAHGSACALVDDLAQRAANTGGCVCLECCGLRRLTGYLWAPPS